MATTYFLGDTTVLLGRSMRHITAARTPSSRSLMPIALMLLFVYVLGGAITRVGLLRELPAAGHPAHHDRDRASPTPPIRLFTDLQSGIFERFQSMPIARSSVLWAHVLTSLVANLISLVLVVLVAVLIGFRSGAGALAWLAIAGILVLFTLALTWLAVIPGLTAKTPDGAAAFAYPIVFLPFVSSAFVPTQTMPGPVRAFASNQPVTSIVNTIRDLFTQQPVSSGIWAALAWCLGILIVAYAAAMATYHRKVA